MNAITSRPDPEQNSLDIGFVPLSDCAPLVAAYEKGFFEQEGLRVTLHRERSWASIRDKTAFGVFDAAQMLYPMPFASTLGIGGPEVPMVAAMCLNLGGNAITVSESLYQEMVEALGNTPLTESNSSQAIGSVVRRRREAGLEPMTMGCVFPTSTHHYELRHWLAAGGVDCALDVQLLVVPPPDMPETLHHGRLDAFCVGEPWNTITVQRGWGRIVMTKQALWNNAPEKVLGVTKDWAGQHPQTHLALLRALLASSVWCDRPDNREELARLIAADHYVGAPVEALRPSMLGRFAFAQEQPPIERPDFLTFHRYAANFPWVSHGVWFLEQMADACQIDAPADPDALASVVLRPDLYRQACNQLELPCPMIDYKPENVHDKPWQLVRATQPILMGPDLMLAREAEAADRKHPSGRAAP